MLDDLRAAAAVLAGVDPSRLPAAELGERVVELRSLIDGLEGVWSRLVRTLDGSGAAEVGTSAWLRSACRLSPAAARSWVMLSRRLAERPGVEAALTRGQISVDHARLVTTALSELEASAGPELASATEAPLVAAARRSDPARLRREIAHARYALTPVAAEARDEQLHDQRHLRVATTFDGAVVVDGLLDPEGGEALLTALAPLTAVSGPDDARTPGQRRADALVELCRRTLDGGALPALGGERPPPHRPRPPRRPARPRPPRGAGGCVRGLHRPAPGPAGGRAGRSGRPDRADHRGRLRRQAWRGCRDR